MPSAVRRAEGDTQLLEAIILGPGDLAASMEMPALTGGVREEVPEGAS